MVTIEPSALRNILAAALFVFQTSCWLNAVVPILPAPVSDIACPGTTSRAVKLLYGDPSDAGRVVVVRDTDVASPSARNRLVYRLGTDATRIYLAAI